MRDLSRRHALIVLLGAAAPFAGALPSVAAETIPLAIKGYDPVAYFTLGSPTPGLPEIEYEWDEHRYRFARDEHRELFKADPARYAPQFADFCTMALTRGELVEIDPQNWVIAEGKLYLFGSSNPRAPDVFQQDLAGNLAKANQHRSLILKR
jgi:hypothetical protein